MPRMRRGFTLAEIMVAMALIAVLAAVLIPTVRGRLQDSYEDALVEEYANLASAIQAYRQDVGKYPPRLDYLSALPASPVDRCNVALSSAGPRCCDSSPSSCRAISAYCRGKVALPAVLRR